MLPDFAPFWHSHVSNSDAEIETNEFVHQS